MNLSTKSPAIRSDCCNALVHIDIILNHKIAGSEICDKCRRSCKAITND